jgi:hypothetical protein
LFYEELSPCLYVSDSSFGPEAEKLKAVGWLAWGHPYIRRQRQLPETPFGQLLRLLEDPWEPVFFMGSHECEFCPDAGLPVSLEGYKGPDPHLEAYYRRHRIERDGLVVHFGAHNLYVPAEGCVYVAPSMIAHYVDVHSYEPPAVFWDAVMNCPEMDSETYRQALMVNGPSHEKWVRAVR